ncbi:MAG: threonine aldolase [Alphaproteobacteria bacterium]|nr:threonine aldolase [Alphaproteobacteria bacterium]
MPKADEELKRRNEAFGRCTIFLSGHKRKPVRQILTELAASPFADAAPDEYGDGELIRSLETQVAALLGKEAAVFSPKGVIAQQAALRVWTERSGSPLVALHPKSHIDFDETAAYERLHNLRPVRLGGDFAPFTVADLERVSERLGVVTVELPLRRAGYRVLPWGDLTAIGDWARAHKVPLHLDGARIWECGPAYDRPYAEIAAIADSVYVSFYKGLGGIAGCVLAGSATFVAEAKVWLGRHGSALVTSFPMVISALDGLKHHLPKMPAYHARAQEIAKALAALPGVRIAPSPPSTNSFQVYLPGTVAGWNAASLALAETSGVSIFRRFAATPFADMVMSEVAIGDACEGFATSDIVSHVSHLIERAR